MFKKVIEVFDSRICLIMVVFQLDFKDWKELFNEVEI